MKARSAFAVRKGEELMPDEVIATKYRHDINIGRAAVAGIGFVLFAVLAVLEFTRGGGAHIALGAVGCVIAAVCAAVGVFFVLAARRVAKLPEELIVLSGDELTVFSESGRVRIRMSELASAEPCGAERPRKRGGGELRLDLKDGRTYFVENVDEPERAAKRLSDHKTMYEYRSGAIERGEGYFAELQARRAAEEEAARAQAEKKAAAPDRKKGGKHRKKH